MVTFASSLILASTFFFTSNFVVTPAQLQFRALPKNTLSNSQQPQNVLFCDLIKDAERYENKLVRVRPSFVVNFESIVLYDSRCNERGNQVELTLDCSSDENCKEMRN